MRENSTWNQLLPAELELMEGWLFDENLGYAKTVTRVQKEFGLKTTIGSVGRYYRRRARERQAEELVEAQLAADGVNGLEVDAASLRSAVVKLAAKAALNLANEKPEEIEKLASLTQLLLEAEQNDLRRRRLELAESHFVYEKTVESFKDLKQSRAYLQSIKDNTRLRQSEKMQAILLYWERWFKRQSKSRKAK